VLHTSVPFYSLCICFCKSKLPFHYSILINPLYRAVFLLTERLLPLVDCTVRGPLVSINDHRGDCPCLGRVWEKFTELSGRTNSRISLGRK